eukprot:scaffold4562_cov255-Pinguiococcus_pyrenoidosus.AAC.13
MLSRAFSRVTSSAAARRMMSSGGIDKWWEKSWADLFMAEIKRDGYRQFFIGQANVARWTSVGSCLLARSTSTTRFPRRRRSPASTTARSRARTREVIRKVKSERSREALWSLGEIADRGVRSCFQMLSQAEPTCCRLWQGASR